MHSICSNYYEYLQHKIRILNTEESSTKPALSEEISIDNNGGVSVKPSPVGDIFPNSARVSLTVDNVRGMDRKTIRLGL